ncbi:MAG TPA: nitroreductase family protein [Anaerolineales bacterium]|nr:nitroreductase family protein [Anaerolineales bacterium]HRQ91474.1 nitroreductase family protein [Anaerolineales bacterium]
MAASLTPQDLHTWLRSRRSARRFLPQPVLGAALQRMLETATYAPNAHNRQPWRFVILESSESRTALATAMGQEFAAALQAEGLSAADIEAQLARSAARLHEAPAAVLLCLDTSVLDTYADPARTQGELHMAMQSVALAGGQLLLAAQTEGLGGVWVCAPLLAQAAAQQALGLPESWLAQGVLYLGYPAGEPQPRPRQAVDEITLWV